MSEVLSTSPFTPSALQAAIAREIAAAPANAFEAEVQYEQDGTLRTTLAVRVDHRRWVLMAGGLFEKTPGQAPRAAAFSRVTVKF